MARWAPEKKDVLDALAAEILHNYGRGRAIVAVDGPDAGITASFADELAEAIQAAHHHVARSSIDGFLRTKAARTADEAVSGPGRYLGAFDYSTFRRVLVEPFRMGLGASFVTSAYDSTRDAPVQTKWRTAPADSILIVDGEFLNRPELSGSWNFSIWLEGRDEDVQRDPAARERYLADAAPRTKATAIMDVSDPEHPRRVFADSC